MQRNSSFLNTETNNVSSKNSKQEEDGLHIQKVLQDLVDGNLMESRDSMSYGLIAKDQENNGDFNIDITTQ